MSNKVIIVKPTLSYALLRCFGLILISAIMIAVSVYFQVFLLLPLLAIPALMICYRVVYWSWVKYEISAVQVKYSRGVFQRKVDFLEMYRIKDFDQEQSLIMRILGMMHIRLMTSDISHPMLELKGIPISNIADVLRQLIEKSRKENRVYAID